MKLHLAPRDAGGPAVGVHGSAPAGLQAGDEAEHISLPGRALPAKERLR